MQSAHLYVNTCPVEWRLPWLKTLAISGPWRLPLRPFSPILLMLLFKASHVSDDDIATHSELSCWPNWSSFSRIWKRELESFRRISHCVLSFWTLTVKHLLQRSTICSLRPYPTLLSGRGEAWWRWGAWLCTVRHLCSRSRHGAWSARRRVIWMNQYEAENF